MSVRIINGKVYKNGAFSEEELVLKEGKIVSAQDGDAEEVYDAKGNYVVGANIAGFEKVVEAMTAQGIV